MNAHAKGAHAKGAHAKDADVGLRRAAAALAFASQAIHLWALPSEFVARPLSGCLVLSVAAGQGLLGAGLLLGFGKWTVRLGLALNTVVLLAWALSRVAGFPALIGYGRLPVGLPDAAEVVIHAALIFSLLGVGRGLKRRRGGRRFL